MHAYIFLGVPFLSPPSEGRKEGSRQRPEGREGEAREGEARGGQREGRERPEGGRRGQRGKEGY